MIDRPCYDHDIFILGRECLLADQTNLLQEMWLEIFVTNPVLNFINS